MWPRTWRRTGNAGTQARHLHELRHHYASVLMAGGENPKVVSKRLGHKDVMVTMRVYAHLFAEAEEKTRDVLDAAWGEPGETGRETESSAASGRIPETHAENRRLCRSIHDLGQHHWMFQAENG